MTTSTFTTDAPPPAGATIPVVTAGVWRRGVALALDLIPLVTLWAFGVAALLDLGELPDTQWNPFDTLVDVVNHQPGAIAAPTLLLGLMLFAWPLLFQRFGRGTPGKRITGLALVNEHGRPLPGDRLALWCALRVLGLGLVLVGPLWALVDPQRRTPYDRIAGAWVVVAERSALPRA